MSEPYDPADPLAGASKCPVCGNHARVVADDDLRFVCGVCGAPRVKSKSPRVALSGREAAPLRQAQKARKSRFLWRVAGLFGGAVGAFGVGVTLLIALVFSPGFAWTAVGLTMALPFVLLALAAFAKNRARSAEVEHHVEEAWKSAVRDAIASAGGELTAAQLTELLPLSEAGAETLLAELNVEDHLRSRITEEGRLAYASQSTARLRIDQAAEGAAATIVAEDGDLEERFRALEEAVAAEEADASTRKRS